VHYSRVFRSSAPSDLLPSSRGERSAYVADCENGSTRSTEWGVGSGSGVSHWRYCPARFTAGASSRHAAGAGPLSGEDRTMRDPELVARAQRAAKRLETAWEQWRALHGLAVAPGQPVVSYVGYSLKEPWGEPRVVIGIDADEAEYLAEFLDRDECAQGGPVRLQAGTLHPEPLQSGPRQQVTLAGSQPGGPQEYSGSPRLAAPSAHGLGRQSPDRVRDIVAGLAGWASGELPGQVAEQLTGWPPGRQTSDRPPGAA
jgi:hypothetical protein